MNHHSLLPIEIEIVRHPGQNVLRLRFHRDAIRDWCLGLCLLKEGLVETFTVVEQDGSGTKVRFLADPQFGARSRVTLNARASEVVMTKNNLDYVEHFFLKHYRDGVAEVDHLDLEAVDSTTGDNEIYVTFQITESRAPMTPEEARKRLGEWS